MSGLNCTSNSALYEPVGARGMVVAATAPLTIERRSDVLLVVAHGAAATVRMESEKGTLVAGDTIMLDRSDAPRIEIAPSEAAALYGVDLWRSDDPVNYS
jgi:hypothetical protein